MKEKFLEFKDGHRLLIIKEGPYIKEDPKHGYCDTCEYVTSGGDIYKVVKPGVKQVSNETWFVRCVTRNGEECWAGCGVREVVEEERPNLFTDFTLPEYCVLHGKKCSHCSCEVSGYCQNRTSNPVDVFKALNKRNTNLNVEILEQREQIRKLETDNYMANDNFATMSLKNMQLEAKCGDQDKEIIELTEKVDKFQVENVKLKQQINELKQNAVDYLKDSCSKLKDSLGLEGIISGDKRYIHIENLQILASKIRETIDENTKLKEQNKKYLFEVKEHLDSLYGACGKPLYLYIGRRQGKTLASEKALADMYNTYLLNENAKLKDQNYKLKVENQHFTEELHQKDRKIAELEKANKSLYDSYYKRGDEMYDYKKALALIDRDSVKHSGRGPSIVEAYGSYEIYGFDFCTTNKNDYTFVVNMLRKARM